MTNDSKRIEAAAKAVFEQAEYIQTPEYAEDIARMALTAADAVMFSDEAIERAAWAVAKHNGYEWLSKPAEIHFDQARAVIAALKGAGDE